MITVWYLRFSRPSIEVSWDAKQASYTVQKPEQRRLQMLGMLMSLVNFFSGKDGTL